MIWFVGAGPGAVDLITVRGQKLLQRADMIIYAGSLVNPALLQFAGEDCEIYNSAEMTLDEVMERMRDGNARGLEIVRLHTGDPSLYGALREQLDKLDELGIPFRVCPGVSSFCGAASALGAEYTLPGLTQSVIITRTEGRTKVPERERLHRLAVHGCTMVLFLSAGLLTQVKEELLAGAYREDTPCALVYKATWEEEKIVRGTLGSLPEMAAENGITKTALVLVGDFLGSDYELSRLYAPDFSTGYRAGTEEDAYGEDRHNCLF